MPRRKTDRRQEQTRAALLRAFRDLILQRHFEEIGVADIAARAQVCRSTLYAHFAGKNGLLAASIAHPFARLAATVGAQDNSPQLAALLQHFWSNRALGRVLFTGGSRRTAVAVLVELVESNLKSGGYAKRGRLILPLKLAAVQLAELLLAPTAAWLTGESSCSIDVLAPALRRVARAALAAMSPALRG